MVDRTSCSRRLVLALLLTACPDRPLDPGDSDAMSSTASGTGVTSEPPTSTGVTSEPPTSTSSATETTAPNDATTVAPTTDETSATTAVDTTGGPLPACGSPCAEPWEHDGSISLDAGADLSQFACLTRVHGGLSLHGDFDPAALAVFAHLEVVDSGFDLTNNDLLTDLSAFACLREVESFNLRDMPALTDASAPRVTRTGAIRITRAGLLALPSFGPAYPGPEDLLLRDNPALADLGAAAGWTTEDPFFALEILDHPALTSIAPLAGLLASTPDPPEVTLARLPALKSLEGLETMTSAYLTLQDLPLVPDLLPLAALEDGAVGLGGMPLVTSLEGLSPTSLSALQIGYSCSLNEHLTGMAGLTDLAGLDALTDVINLRIGGNPNLTSLAGAGALQSVGVLDLVSNPALPPAAIEAFTAGLAMPPQSCVGDGDACPCPAMP